MVTFVMVLNSRGRYPHAWWTFTQKHAQVQKL